MNKKLRKAIGCVCLALAIAITQIPARGVMAASDFKMDGTRIVGYTGTASAVSIPADAEIIESDAFANCKTMTSVKIPKNVKVIGAGAFRGCDNLKTVSIAEGIQEIDNQAFSDCKNLVSINIPSSVETLESGVFAGDKSLESVTIDLKNPRYVCRDGVIYTTDLKRMVEMCPGRLTSSYALPASVETIDKYAFWGCRNLTDVDISHYMGDVPAFAFSYCRNLETMEIPPSVNRINAKAFENCRKLSDVIIPTGVEYIASNAFDGCPKLNIIAPPGSVGYEFFQNFDASQAALSDYEDEDDIVVTSTTTNTTVSYKSISQNQYPAGDVSKSDVSDVSYSNMPSPQLDGYRVIGGSRIVGGNAVVFVDNSKMNVLDSTYVATPVSSNSVSGNDLLVNQKYTIVGGNTIADRSYYGDKEMTSFVFPDGIERIGDFAFARSGLSEMNIPEGVKSIGYGAFYHCDNLSSIRIPNSVTNIEPSAFGHTAWLSNWQNGLDSSDFLIVGDGNLIAYKGHGATVGIPQGVKRICGEVFMDHPEITSVALPTSLVEVGEDAFHGCTGLTNLIGGQNLTKISDRAFYNCPIPTIHIGEQTVNIGLQAFGGANTDSVVFASTQIPTLSCEKTATRLSNEDYRDYAIGCHTAVVPMEADDFDNTILDERTKGFRGLVVSKILDAVGNQPGSVTLKYCSLEADENGVVSVPDTVVIDGATYVIESMQEGAFDAYADRKWMKSPFKNISVSGTITKGRDVNASLRKDEAEDGNNPESVHVVDQIGIQNEKQFKAELSNADETYQLIVSHNEEAEAALKEAVSEQYGIEAPTDLFTMDLALYDATGQIPITKLGKEKMDVTMSIPAGLQNSTLCVMTLDGNGQLEAKLLEYVQSEDETCINFEVSHFSPYGIYRATGELAEKIDTKIGKSSGSSLKDKSPDTGDYFDPKWFLALGMLCLALILILKKDKVKIEA